MIWNNPGVDEYPAVQTYAQKVKYAIMTAHDSIIAARVKQTRDANRHRRPAPFERGDLVYLSTKNISLPKGLARKLIPKFIGPYRILTDFGNNSYRLELPSRLRQQGVHDVFHSSLLRIHEPNDDRLFPGRLDRQVAEIEGQEEEWAIDKIVAHAGSGENTIFETVWKSGDHTWVPYATVAGLDALKNYLELVGVDGIKDLPPGSGNPPTDDPQLFLGLLEVSAGPAYIKEGIRHTTSPTTYAVDNVSRSLSCHSSHETLPTHLPPSLHMTDPLQNAYAVRLKETQCVALFDVDDHSYRYSLSQLRLYAKYNLTLRSPKFNYARTPTPGGYDEFVTLWNRDYACPWKFAYLDDGQVVVPGDPIAIHVLAPPTSSDPEKVAELEDDLREMSRFIAKRAIANDKAGERKKKIRLEAKQFPSASSRTVQQFKRGLRSGRQSRAATPRAETESLRGSVPPESIRGSVPPLDPINDPTLALLDDNTHLEGASTDHAGGEGSKDKGGERAADGEDVRMKDAETTKV
ncbi:unnamed protein product [Somion occarium]|uniref:Tf2-1-like SH3-like domain-containing protein n=1 Tax=Somion occarium TaxID=3059160 RepID=A0ABP1CSN7_9APHY